MSHINCELVNYDLFPAMLKRMGKELDFTAAESVAMGKRLAQSLKLAGKTQAWLAKAMNVSTAHTNKMVKQGTGSLASWALACKLLNASMDYVVLGRGDVGTDAQTWLRELMRTSFKHVPNANKVIAEELKRL